MVATVPDHQSIKTQWHFFLILVAKSQVEDCIELSFKYIDYQTVLQFLRLLDLFACNRSVKFVKSQSINLYLYTAQSAGLTE